MNFCKKKVLSFLKQKTPSDRVGWGSSNAIILLGKNDEICVHSNATNSP